MKTTFIEDTCELITDGTHYTPPDVGEGFPFLTVKDMSVKGLDFVNCSHISPSEYDKANAGNSSPKVGDVLFSKDGTVGKVHVVSEKNEFAILSSIAILRPKKDIVDSNYFGYVLGSPITLDQAVRRKTGSAIRRIILKDLKRVKVPLPPLDEQKRIAEIIDKADAIRRKRKEAIALTEELLRSTFLDMFGDPVINPKGWKTTPLEEFAIIQSGIAKGKKINPVEAVLMPYIRVANVQDGYLNFDEIKELKILPKDINRYLLQDGDLLLTEGGDPDKLGRGAIWHSQIDPCIHQNHIFAVRPKHDVTEPEYLSALIGSEYGKRYFLRAAKQTTGIATINKTQLKDFPALLPPINLQRKYTKFVQSLKITKEHYYNIQDNSENLFNSLLQKAFRGEL